MSQKQWKKAIMLVWRHAAQHKYEQSWVIIHTSTRPGLILILPEISMFGMGTRQVLMMYTPCLLRYANLFLHPVREDDAPGYRGVIHRPMDLSTIKRNIENGVSVWPIITTCTCTCTCGCIWPYVITTILQTIKTDIEFQRDMLLMFQNAFMYNSSDHDV